MNFSILTDAWLIGVSFKNVYRVSVVSFLSKIYLVFSSRNVFFEKNATKILKKKAYLLMFC